MKKESFSKAVGDFLVALHEVNEKGFFADMQIYANGDWDAGIRNLSLEGTGCLPTRGPRPQGLMVKVVNPVPVIQALLAQVKDSQVKYYRADIASEDWPRWDKANKRIIGSQGVEKRFSLNVQLKRGAPFKRR